MAKNPPRVFKSAGEGQANRYQAAQAAYELASVVEDQIPSENALPEEWAEYVLKAYGKAAAAVIEVGKRINKAHEAYSAQPQRWGRTWDHWCQQNLGFSRTYADRLRRIGQNLGSITPEIWQKLPGNYDSLYTLARVYEQNKDLIEQGAETGLINPNMTRAEAKSLLPNRSTSARKSTKRQRVPGCSLSVEEARKLEAIASERNQKTAELVGDVLTTWLALQPMPVGTTTIEVSVVDAGL